MKNVFLESINSALRQRYAVGLRSKYCKHLCIYIAFNHLGLSAKEIGRIYKSSTPVVYYVNQKIYRHLQIAKNNSKDLYYSRLADDYNYIIERINPDLN